MFAIIGLATVGLCALSEGVRETVLQNWVVEPGLHTVLIGIKTKEGGITGSLVYESCVHKQPGLGITSGEWVIFNGNWVATKITNDKDYALPSWIPCF